MLFNIRNQRHVEYTLQLGTYNKYSMSFNQPIRANHYRIGKDRYTMNQYHKYQRDYYIFRIDTLNNSNKRNRDIPATKGLKRDKNHNPD